MFSFQINPPRGLGVLCHSLSDRWLMILFYSVPRYGHNITRCVLKKIAQKIAPRMCWNEDFISALHKRSLWLVSPAKAKQQTPPKLAVQRDYRFDAPDKRWPGFSFIFFLSKCPLTLEHFALISGKMRGRPDQSQWHNKATAAESCVNLSLDSLHINSPLKSYLIILCASVCVFAICESLSQGHLVWAISLSLGKLRRLFHKKGGKRSTARQSEPEHRQHTNHWVHIDEKAPQTSSATDSVSSTFMFCLARTPFFFSFWDNNNSTNAHAHVNTHTSYVQVMYNWWAQQRGVPWEGPESHRIESGIRPTFCSHTNVCV